MYSCFGGFIRAKISSIPTSPERDDTILVGDPLIINLREVNF